MRQGTYFSHIGTESDYICYYSINVPPFQVFN
nr:MAG TPA: hypothetical protein [Caudoviricetes sp.]